LIGQAQGGGYHGGGGGFGGGGRVGRWWPGGTQLEAEAVSVVVAPRAAPAFGGDAQTFWSGKRAAAELASAYRAIFIWSTSVISAAVYNGRVGRSVTPVACARTAASRPQNRFSSIRMLLGNGRRQLLIVQRSLQLHVHLEQVHTGD